MEFWYLPIIDTSNLGGSSTPPTFRTTTDCPFNWEWIALAFVAGALVVYYARK